ncbi:MAG: hypothetical protein ACRCSP_00645 [Rhodoglobus sp.]
MSETVITAPPHDAHQHPRSLPAPVPSPLAAWLMALGSFLGLVGFAWDMQWHSEVGPDTFFTVPHLFIYSGSALTGLVCLVVSLRILNAERISGDRLSLNPIPRPYLIGGFGTVLFLLCGLWDEWWHSIYGFDVTIISPPHIGLLTCNQIGMVGTVTAFAAMMKHTDVPRSRPSLGAGIRRLLGSRGLGLASMVACSVCFLVFFSGLTRFLRLDGIGIETGRVYLGVIFVVAFLFAASATRLRFSATCVALLVIALKFVMTWFTLTANDWYANQLGLFLRDSVLADPTQRASRFSENLPSSWVMLATALLIDIVLLLGARRSARLEAGPTPETAARATAQTTRLLIMISGGLGGILMSFYYAGSRLEQPGLLFVTSPGTVVALGIVGAGAALMAWQLGTIARAIR